MPERLDRITVTVPDGDVSVSWATREELMRLLAQRDDTAAIRSRFDAVGASRPVELTREERVALRDLIGEWLYEEVGRPEEQGLTDLYIAINRGEPWEYSVEAFAAGDAGDGPELSSQNWRWRWMQWRDRRDPDDDHQHCRFCHTNIQDDAVSEAWCSHDQEDYERWVCAGCFEKLHERFGWKVEPDATGESIQAWPGADSRRSNSTSPIAGSSAGACGRVLARR